MKSIFASKTAWVGAIMALIGIIDQFSPFIPAEYRKYALAFSGILVIVMRLLTGEPIAGTPKAKGLK